MELDELLTLCKETKKVPDFYGLKAAIITKLEEYRATLNK
jgi:hypothetical protein